MAKKNIIIACVAFVITGAIGFGITKLVKPSTLENGQEDNLNESSLVTETKEDSSMVTTGYEEKLETVEAEESQIAKETDADALKKAEEALKKAEEAKKGKQMTAAQLTSIINGNGNDYPRGIVINVVGNKANEQASSIAMIRQYKKMGTWSNITVTHVEYDENNKVRAITVKVVSHSFDSED